MRGPCISLSLSGRVKCILLVLCLSFYEWRCIYPGEQMILAPFLEKRSLDRAPGWFADNLSVRKHAKADVLLTTVLGPLRCWAVARFRFIGFPFSEGLFSAGDVAGMRP